MLTSLLMMVKMMIAAKSKQKERERERELEDSHGGQTNKWQ